MKQGKIPKKLVAHLRKSQEMIGSGHGHNSWSFPADIRETAGFSKFEARPAFVVPADSEAFNKTALHWAQDGTPRKDVGRVEIDNVPFTDLRWVGIDSRMNGGVAYKVVTPQGWLVDLREDVMLDVLYEGAIHPYVRHCQGAGTYLTCSFIWAQMGSQMRLIRYKSKLHLDIEETSAAVAIPESDLEVGGVYEDKRGNLIMIIAKGTEKGKKFRCYHCYDNTDWQKDYNFFVGSNLENSSLYFCGSIKLYKKVGQVKV